jgi:4-amino-4-deoxy-L-arabinose transferase-like glycosyltransferase
MLTYNENIKPKRKDRPWLLVVLVLIWVLGTAFFHSPWEPYEPFVLSVVKGILRNNSWLVPYVSDIPYLQIQPFYFWIYSAILKAFAITDIYSIANGIRLINTFLIFAVIALSAKIGSNLSAFKNGRSVVLILISSIGFINLSYQLSPDIVVIFGFCLYLYALQLHKILPGLSGWLLFTGLLLVSIAFSCEFILIALSVLLVLPLVDKYWRNKNYIMTCGIGVALFIIIFYIYCTQLQQVDKDFFWQWKIRYLDLINRNNYNTWRQVRETLLLLSWYTLPCGFLAIWTMYKRRLNIFKDKIIQVNILLVIILIAFTIISGKEVDRVIFPIIIPLVFIASLEIDSIRITIVSLFNWFSIFVFGTLGFVIWAGYIMFNLNAPQDIISKVLSFSQNFSYQFKSWQLLLAIAITLIWLFMITRRHIRGREVVTNWASGTTFILVLFMALWLPWFDSVLSFKPLVNSSLKNINKKLCIVTNGSDTVQGALWYYYADVNLLPSTINLNYNICNQAIVATDDLGIIDQNQWQILWHAKRPIDKKEYFMIKHK